jgi:hypothetical protein
MEFASFVSFWPSLGVFRLTRTKLAEIFGGAWSDIGEKFHFYTSQWLSCNDDQ